MSRVPNRTRCWRRFLAAVNGALVALFLVGVASGEHLPLRRYTLADGLPSESVTCEVRDSHDFLWFCTSEGLSRFDGYGFVNYGVEQGLPDRAVTALLETPSHEYWLGTARGLVRFIPKPDKGESMFSVFALDTTDSSRMVTDLTAGSNGSVWVATLGGVFRLTKESGTWVAHHIQFPAANLGTEGPIMEDHAGNLWVVFGENQLYRRRQDGVIEHFDDHFFHIGNRINSLVQDRSGNIWLSSYRGLAVLVDDPRPDRELIARIYGKKDGLGDYTGAVFQSSDGKLWVGSKGLLQIRIGQDAAHARFKAYGRSGFSSISAEDASGNFWMGSTRLARYGFVTYGKPDGLSSEDVRSILEGHDGKLYVITGLHSRFFHRFEGGRFVAVRPSYPHYNFAYDWFWGWGQIHFQDKSGEWWVAASEGVFRYPKVNRLEELAHTRPRMYTQRNGFFGGSVFRFFEDSHSDVWISSWGGSGLTRFERATSRFHEFTLAEGWSPVVATAFAENRSGAIWVGTWSPGIRRYTRGKFQSFQAVDGFPNSAVACLLTARNGELWIGTTRGGLIRVIDPGADHPTFRAYTTREGLSSNNVRALAEDHQGRIYFWTDRGVDRLTPSTGRVRRYTTADGIQDPGSDHQVAYCDRSGRLWFGFDGLFMLDPQTDPPDPPPPPIRITNIRIRGVAYPISELGEANLGGVVLGPNQNHIEIEFASLNFGGGEGPRYQYKLDNADRDWSLLSTIRSVNFAEVRPGHYRFLVRAVDEDGIASLSPATVEFRVLAPIWQRWWFAALFAAMAVALLYAGHRYRVGQLLAVERLRNRLAGDLHDEIGAGLSQIAIVSELAKRELSMGGEKAENSLDHVAEISRELVDSMSEIVWAISPRGDALESLVQRMRRFGNDVLAPRDVEFDFHILHSEHGPSLRADIRRQIFLIFKEAIHNAGRHSGCKRVSASLAFDDGELLLTITDDGAGFRPEANATGNGEGLLSMERRARDLRGAVEITSAKGQGTQITVRVPLKPRPRFLRHTIST